MLNACKTSATCIILQSHASSSSRSKRLFVSAHTFVQPFVPCLTPLYFRKLLYILASPIDQIQRSNPTIPQSISIACWHPLTSTLFGFEAQFEESAEAWYEQKPWEGFLLRIWLRLITKNTSVSSNITKKTMNVSSILEKTVIIPKTCNLLSFLECMLRL